MAAVDLPAPGRGSGTAPDPSVPVAVGGFSLRVFDAGLACCAVEVSAALRRCAELLADGGSSPHGAGPGDLPEPGEWEQRYPPRQLSAGAQVRAAAP